MHYSTSVYSRGTRSGLLPPPHKSEPEFYQMYQCTININTGVNIAIEFTLEGLIFEKIWREEVKLPRALPISVYAAKRAANYYYYYTY